MQVRCTQPQTLTLAHLTALAAGTHFRVAIHPSREVPAPRPPLTLPHDREWRNDDEDYARVAKEMADAQNQWKRLDDHPHLTSAMNKPPDSNGNPYIPGAAMFLSLTISPGTIFVGERWCETHEAVTVMLRNMTSARQFTTPKTCARL